MLQIFQIALYNAAAAMLVAAAWIIAVAGLLTAIAAVLLILGAAFDVATRLIAWYWAKTKHKPRSKLEQIIMDGHGL